MASVQFGEGGNGLSEKTDQRDNSEAVLLDPCLLSVARKGSTHLCKLCCINMRYREDRPITRGPGLEWRSGGLESGPAVPVITSHPKAMQDQTVISIIDSFFGHQSKAQVRAATPLQKWDPLLTFRTHSKIISCASHLAARCHIRPPREK